MLASLRALLDEIVRSDVAQKLVVAASGGPDSTALLVTASELRGERGFELVAATVNHGIRPEAVAEAAAVRTLCARLDVSEFHLLHGDAAAEARAAGTSLQDGARRVRYRLLGELARTVRAPLVVTGHTLEDQAETVLLRLIRGAGIAGLAGMPRVRPMAAGVLLGRPFLRISRDDVHAFLAQRGLAAYACDDPSNRDRRFARVRIRESLLPALRRENPRVVVRLAELAVEAGRVDAYLAAQAVAWLDAHVGEDGTLDAAAFQHVATPLQPVIVRQWMLAVRGYLRQLDRCHIAAVIAQLKRTDGSAEVSLPEGWVVRRAYDRAVMVPSSDEPGPGPEPEPDPCRRAVQIEAPGQMALAWRQRVLTVTRGRSGEVAATAERAVVPDRLPILVRGRAPGDVIRTKAGTKKLSDLFIDAKIPRAERARWPVVTSVGEQARVLWVPGLAVASGSEPAAGEPALILRILPAGKE